MAYEAAAAVALRGQSQVCSREDKVVEEGKAVMKCGVLRILRRVLPLSKAPAPSSAKK
uniref:Uncharacterized protein n=1 Tax=Setaria viridis TaxID=4556 RepID=A0A4V6D515_SETVI|nr:hypothetical protein SEVIR_6G041000v2 [Setaria viridis]